MAKTTLKTKPKSKVTVKTVKQTGSKKQRLAKAAKLFPSLNYTNGFGEWIFDKCCKDGTVTVPPARVKTIFGIKSLTGAERLCREKGMTLKVNLNQSYTFDLTV